MSVSGMAGEGTSFAELDKERLSCMTESERDAALEKARAFFDRAEQVAATDNFDYAIDMYLEGLRLSPDALEDGHLPLRKLALIRQGKGGKKPSMVDKIKKRGGKNELEEMLNSEYLLAKDPDNLSFAEGLMKAAVKGGWNRTAEWITDLVCSALANQEKPSLSGLLLVKDSYVKLGILDKAVSVCARASRLRPEDGFLQEEVKNLSAQAAMKKGKYAEAGGFQESIKDKELQQKLHDQESSVKSDGYRVKMLDEAKKKLEKEPQSLTSRIRYCDALFEMNTQEAYIESIRLLNGYFEETGEFSYKRHLGELEIKNCRRMLGLARKELEKQPAVHELESRVRQLSAKLGQLEFEHFKACVEANPSDLKCKYELGLRYLFRKQFDEAIPLLQDARRELRLKFQAMDKIGICFFYKGWYDDAVDIFKEAIDNYELEDDSVAKELRYNLARSYEEAGKGREALDLYRKLAQMDYSFKDVRARIDELRREFQ